MFILLLLLLAVQVRYTGVQLDYLFNKAYISAELCLQRDIPDNTCQGKCHMMKEMEQMTMPLQEAENLPESVTLCSFDYLNEKLDSAENHLTSELHSEYAYYLVRDTRSGLKFQHLPPPEIV
jgi:hypothetical protein